MREEHSGIYLGHFNFDENLFKDPNLDLSKYDCIFNVPKLNYYSKRSLASIITEEGRNIIKDIEDLMIIDYPSIIK